MKLTTYSHMKTTKFILCTATILAIAAVSSSFAGDFHDKLEKRKAEAAKQVPPPSVAQSFLAPMTYDKVYDETLTFLKKNDYVIESANKETGQITTVITQETTSWKQTGSRVTVTLIKEGDKSTAIKLVVSDHTRYKALVTEPWGNPKVNAEKTSVVIAKIKPILAPSSGIASVGTPGQ